MAKVSVRVLSKKVVADEIPSLEFRIGNQIFVEQNDYVVKCTNVICSRTTLEIEGKKVTLNKKAKSTITVTIK